VTWALYTVQDLMEPANLYTGKERAIDPLAPCDMLPFYGLPSKPLITTPNHVPDAEGSAVGVCLLVPRTLPL